MASSNPPPPFLSMGLSTYHVSMSLFQENRLKLVTLLKEQIHTTKSNNESSPKSAAPEQITSSVIYLQGGKSKTRFDSDHEPVFRQESYFHYLFGVKEPDCAGLIHIETAKSVLFVPELSAEYATFMGKLKTRDEIREEYGVDQVLYTKEMEHYLQSVCGCLETSKILVMDGMNSDSGKRYKTPSFSSCQLESIKDTTTLFPILAECRVQKSAQELDLIRHATEISSMAHTYTMKNTKPGMMEYQSESLFRHYAYYNFGARHVAYTSICGCGPNAAVLHYGHAGAPNNRQIQDGDLCLFDMGAEYFCYDSDVTCTFPANGVFNDRQRIVYEGVLDAQRAVYKMLKPGVNWKDCHEAAEEEILKALIKLNVVLPGNKSVKELVDMRLGAVFMPHGLGHFIGIDTHDVGGYLDGHPQRIQKRGLKSLRTARDIKPNMTLTVEPGCYFIDHLIDEALADDSNLKEYLNRDVLSDMRTFGGVRLEDVVAITDDGCVNFTLCPRTIEEVESVKAGGKWPPIHDTALELRRIRLTDMNVPLPNMK